jgi:rhodanese-related sulfurtransferase
MLRFPLPFFITTRDFASWIALVFLLLLPQAARGGHETDDEVLTITVEQVKALFDAREKMIIIDLRFQKARLPGARSGPIKELPKRYTEIPRSGRVVLYCDCPQNQIIEDAYMLLKDYGYRNTAVMSDGFQAWARYKYPVESGRGK